MGDEQILLVEDNARNMALLRDVLHATGYQTLEASTGRQALDLASEHTPALVLMDIRLPDMDGTDALRLLRSEARTASIPVFAVTAEAMAGDRERFLEAGFDAYLAKPIDVDELLATIRLYARDSAVLGPNS
jgi:two-component system, cell cycle response regulator DivK